MECLKMTVSNHNNLPEFTWNDSRSLIEVDALEKVFKSAAGEARVLKNIHLKIDRGEFVSIIGRSGSGKSTLINMLTGIDHATSGTVRIGETLLQAMPEGKMAAWRGRMLGIVFQFFQLLPTLTLLENVLLPMDFCNMYPMAEREDRALHLLDLVGLKALAHKLPGAVSGGQQQSAAVARALANDAPIIAADEPTGNLDSASAEDMLGLFEELVRQGKTILMVTHDRTLAKRTGRSILLADGEIVDDLMVWAFPGLRDAALLELSRRQDQQVLPPGSRLNPAGKDGMPDVLVVRQGGLEVENCPGLAAAVGEAARILPGQWLDLRWLSAQPGCGTAQIKAWADGPVSLSRIRGDVVDRASMLRLPGAVSGGRP
jgi:putative ABC transport system ATP-binding protein